VRSPAALTGRRVWSTVLVVGLIVAAAGVACAEARLFELALKDGRLPESQRLLRVQQGDEVTLRWTSDRAFTLHLHGYDLEAKIGPGAPVELRFTARATGRFPLEIHGASAERTVGHLEVHPR
jgi:FtsP/CotA-like multicopper oxidase with cupredoxin domain